MDYGRNMNLRLNFLVLIFSKEIFADVSLQILHANDIHARFVETDVHSSPCSPAYASRGKCYGGFARMRHAVRTATEEADRRGIASVFLNGGDNFQGTVYYTMYKWEIVADLVSKMGFDVVTLGNHEFDNGIENLASYVKNMKAPVVCCNLELTNETRLQLPNLTPSKVLEIRGTKIGIIGYLTPETTRKAQTGRVEILDEITSIRAEAKRLKGEGVKIIIALGHSGFDKDVEIAENVEEISVVVGAHSHSLLYSPTDHPPSTDAVTASYPTIVKQKSGKMVPVVQAYAYTKYLGQLFVTFNENGDAVEATGNSRLLNGSLEKDAQVEEQVAKWVTKINREIKQVKGYTRVFLAKSDFNAGHFESNLANLITDAFLDEAVRNARDNGVSTWTRASVAIYTNGGIHAALDHEKNGGAMTVEDLFNVLPYENQICEISVYGKTVKEILEISVSAYSDRTKNRYVAGFLHFSGMRVVYDLSEPAGNRVRSVQVLCSYCDVPKFEPLVGSNIYNIVTVDYWLEKLKAYESVRNSFITKTVLGMRDIDLLMKYVEKNVIVYPKLDNRITVVGFEALGSDSSSCTLLLTKYLFWAMILRAFY